MDTTPDDPGRVSASARQLSREPATGLVLLVVAATLGGWLLHEIHTTIGLSSPRFWELLKGDRVFDLAMLDFFLTAGWAALVLIERARGRSRWLWLAVGVFMVVPTLGIALFLLMDRGGQERRSTSTR
jgi:hypothetical protein